MPINLFIRATVQQGFTGRVGNNDLGANLQP